MSPRRRALQVALLMAAALLWRGAFGLGHYLDLDAAIYQRAAADHARHLAAGDWMREAPTGASYSAIEYWPPLYPLLSGMVAAAGGCSSDTSSRLVSMLAGWLTMLPVYLLGRRLWGHRAGMWAAALIGFSPRLAWYGTVSRTEALYVLLFSVGAACALAPARRGAACWLCGGAAFALAFLTRFDGLSALLAAALGAVVLQQRRAGTRVALLTVGFVAVAGIYWCWLAWVNGGQLALVAPQKVLMDRLEAVWTTDEMGTLDDFVGRFGPPGLGRFDPAQVALIPTKSAGWWLWHGLRGLPHALGLGLANLSWTVIFLAACTLARRARDRRVWALLALALPAVPVGMGSFWDPAARYFAFWVPLAALIAAPTLARWRVSQQLSLYMLPLLLAGDLFVADGRHFDIPFPLDAAATPTPFLSVGRWVVAEAAVVTSALALALHAPFLAGPAAAVTGFAWVIPMHGWLRGVFEIWTLGALALTLGVYMGMRVRHPAAALAVAWLAVASLSLGAMHVADAAVARMRWSDAVAGWLRGHPEVHRVVASNGLDVLRAGADWVLLPPPPDPRAVASADAFIVSWPMPACTLAAEVQRGRYLLLASFTSSGGGPAWRIYATPAEARGGSRE